MFYTLHVVEPLRYDSVLIEETNEWMRNMYIWPRSWPLPWRLGLMVLTSASEFRPRSAFDVDVLASFSSTDFFRGQMSFVSPNERPRPDLE